MEQARFRYNVFQRERVASDHNKAALDNLGRK